MIGLMVVARDSGGREVDDHGASPEEEGCRNGTLVSFAIRLRDLPGGETLDWICTGITLKLAGSENSQALDSEGHRFHGLGCSAWPNRCRFSFAASRR